MRRSELVLSLAALLGVALLGVLEGIVVAVVLVARPTSCAGPGVRTTRSSVGSRTSKGYHDIDRHPEAAQIPGLVLYRFDAPIFFANAELFADRLQRGGPRPRRRRSGG